jgi:Tyrosine phosphatase family
VNAGRPHVARALEDLPEEVCEEAAEIAGTGPGLSFRRRVEDDLETAGLDTYGTLEQTPLLRCLARYPVTPYTYRVSERASRGQRPGPAKLADLALREGYRVTINLCAEMADGDDPVIAAAGLAGALRTRHVPITDMEPPTVGQVTEILDLLSGPGAEPTYVHCEAGKGRTGAAIACYRMAVMGWSPADALTEAANFGCFAPGQLAFIRAFGDLLLTGLGVGRYPLLPPGSVKATPEQLTATVRTAADRPDSATRAVLLARVCAGAPGQPILQRSPAAVCHGFRQATYGNLKRVRTS